MFAFNVTCGKLIDRSFYFLHRGILDELHQCAFDESVEEENRLLIPEPSNGIDLARSSIAFG